MGVERLGHVAIRVADMARAKSFYLSLGMQLVWDASDWAYLTAGADGLALLGPGYKAAGPHFAFHFKVRSEIDAIHSQLQSAGHSCGSILEHRDGTASFYLQDSEGNWLEMLYEPPGGIPSNLEGDAKHC